MPPYGCRGPAALANEVGVAGVGPSCTVELVPTLPGDTNVVLVGRAITVPFAAVVTGPEGAATDNATAAVACIAPYFRRLRSRSNWLCKQEVRPICGERPELQWSALGPRGTGYLGFPAGMSGHER